jgi:hypothetical protein
MIDLTSLFALPLSEDVLGDVLAWPYLKHYGMWLEFGVYSGKSLRRMAAVRGQANVFGFDSFDGLPEAWAGREKEGYVAGTFKVGEQGLPKVSNATLVIGWFNETLPRFALDYYGPATLVHIDCDIYSSTKCAFDYVWPHLEAGSVVVFDELHSYPGWEQHEAKALSEMMEESPLRIQWIARGVEQAALVVLA